LVVETTPAVGVSRRRIIKRPRLTRMLDEGGARIILLVAPAGYGKTTLAREWLADRRAAWYHGGPASADVAALAVGLATAAAEIAPGAGDRMRQRLRATDRPEEDAQILAEMLAEDLAEWPEDAWLAIDDYHFASGSAACEIFLEEVSSAPSLRLFVVSRRRPRWATARRRIYGDVQELNSAALAMSDNEALDVLEPSGIDAAGLLELAAGWPAVIGLAALTGALAMPADELPTALYDYFAEELYQAAEPGVRWGLCQLAIPPSIDTDLAQFLFGTETAGLVLDHAVRLGIVAHDRGTFELHPLLRRFFETKLGELGQGAAYPAVEKVVEFLTDRKRWDEAFSLVLQFRSRPLLVRLVEAAWRDLLSEGRVATLARWLNHGDELRARSPILDFARAQVAFREAAYSNAEGLALAAATALGPQHPFTSQAFVRAGQSAHFEAREETAFEHHRNATQTAQTHNDLAEALWGEFISGLELERSETAETFDRLAALGSASPSESIRLGAGRLFLAVRTGTGLPPELFSVAAVVEQVDDPLVRLSFLHARGAALAFTGRYEEALAAITEHISELEKYRLVFALPHSYLQKAVAFQGLRKYREAQSCLDMAVKFAPQESYVTSSASAIRTLICLDSGDVEGARRQLGSEIYDLPLPSLRGECLACRALVLACCGEDHVVEALKHADLATRASRAIEPKVIAEFARAVVALSQGDPGAQAAAHGAFLTVRASTNFNNLVRAYRACPPLAEVLATIDDCRPELAMAMIRAGDDKWAQRLDLSISATAKRPTPEADLSPREGEVFELLRQGFSNKAIAQALFISEATVKVHVRRILGKLGVRTRTQAALKDRPADL
jgi:LuxR family transcriptional regulator, maltose regulon positive regulatory protein